MKYHAVIFTLLLLVFSMDGMSQVQIIFDTDIGGDADDLGALAMLNHFIDTDEADLLAVMSWANDTYAVPAIDAVNTFFGHPDIPVAVRTYETYHSDENYCMAIANQFPHKLTNASVPLALETYRRILANHEDHSIVIVAVGPLKNIMDLLQSGPDEYSSLTGEELFNKKVKQFVVMGGKFPEGKNEWNFNGNMPGVTRYVFNHVKVPVVFSGFEIGAAIHTGEVFNHLDKHHPLYAGFMYFSSHAPWVKDNFKGRILDNSTFDQTAVLYAVKGGVGTYWERVEGGYCEIDENGDDRWIQGAITNQSYLVLKEDPEKMATLIEGLMIGNKAKEN